MTRLALVRAGLAGLAATALAAPAHADTLRRTVTPMARADGAVCDLLRAELARIIHKTTASAAVVLVGAGRRGGGVS